MQPSLLDEDEAPAATLHVVPADGLHAPSPSCWCQPVRDSRDPVTGAEVWIHNAHRQ